MGILAGFAIVTAVYSTCAALSWVLPGRKVVGYACDVYTGKPLEYKLNGLAVLLTVLSSYLILGAAKVVPASFIMENYASCVLAANAYGLFGSYLLYLRGRGIPEEKRQLYYVSNTRPAVVTYDFSHGLQRAPTRDRPEKAVVTEEDRERDRRRPQALHFFLGQEFNLRYKTLDLKMFLYVVGAVMLGLNVYSAVALQVKNDGVISKASIAYAWMFTHFLFEYLFFEEIHLYVYSYSVYPAFQT